MVVVCTSSQEHKDYEHNSHRMDNGRTRFNNAAPQAVRSHWGPIGGNGEQNQLFIASFSFPAPLYSVTVLHYFGMTIHTT